MNPAHTFANILYEYIYPDETNDGSEGRRAEQDADADAFIQHLCMFARMGGLSMVHTYIHCVILCTTLFDRPKPTSYEILQHFYSIELLPHT